MLNRNKWFSSLLTDKTNIVFIIEKKEDSEIIECCWLTYINWKEGHGEVSYLYRRKEMATNPIQPIKAERISTATIREDLRDNILAFRLSPLQQ